MAKECGKTLNELLGWPGSVTHRQYVAWVYWREEQWEQPDLTHYYLMQISRDVCRVLSKHPNKIQIPDFKLSFGNKSSSQKKKQMNPAQYEQAWKARKSMWQQVAMKQQSQLPPDDPRSTNIKTGAAPIPIGAAAATTTEQPARYRPQRQDEDSDNEDG